MVDDDLPPLDRALAELGPERVTKLRDGAYILDGVPAGNADLIIAANKKRSVNHKPLIAYPGVWPRPDLPRIVPDQEQERAQVEESPALQKAQRAGRWSFLSPQAAACGVVTPPFEELDELASHLNRLSTDNSPETWDAANAHLDMTFKRVCQYMRDRSPRRAQTPAQPAGGEGT